MFEWGGIWGYFAAVSSAPFGLECRWRACIPILRHRVAICCLRERAVRLSYPCSAPIEEANQAWLEPFWKRVSRASLYRLNVYNRRFGVKYALDCHVVDRHSVCVNNRSGRVCLGRRDVDWQLPDVDAAGDTFLGCSLREI